MPCSVKLLSRRLPVLLACAAGILAVLTGWTASAGTEGRFHLEAKWTLGGLGRWNALAVDPASKNLYVVRQDRVEVIDRNTGRQLSSIGGFAEARGIAFDQSGHGYVSDGAGRVVVFDSKLNRVIRTLPAGSLPNTILFDPASNTIWVFDLKGNRAFVIQATTQAGVAEVKLSGRPGFAAVDGHGLLYVGLTEEDGIARIAKIDTRSRAVLSSWPVPACADPAGVAADRAGARVFVACGDGILRGLDTSSGKLMVKFKIGRDPGDAAYSEPTRSLLIAEGGGRLSIVRKSKAGDYKIAETVSTLPGARVMALDPSGKRAYLAAADQRPEQKLQPQRIHPRIAVTPGPFVILVVEAGTGGH